MPWVEAWRDPTRRGRQRRTVRLDLGKEGHQIHQWQIDALDFSLENILQEQGHIGLGRIRGQKFHLSKVLAKTCKANATLWVVIVTFRGLTAIGRLLSLGLCGTFFLQATLFGYSQGMFVVKDKGTLVGAPSIMELGGVSSSPSAGGTPCVGFVVNKTNHLALCRRFPKFSLWVFGTASPGTSKLGILRVLGLTSCLVDVLLVTRFRVGVKIMVVLSTDTTNDVSNQAMQTLGLPSIIHNMNHVGIESLSEVSLDTLKSSLGLEFAKVNDGLISKVS